MLESLMRAKSIKYLPLGVKLGSPFLVAAVIGIVAYLGSTGELSFSHAATANSQTTTATATYPACPNSSAQGSLCWSGDFETGDLSQYSPWGYCYVPGTKTPQSAVIVNSPVRAGSHALEISVNDNDIPANTFCNGIGSPEHPNTKLSSKFAITNSSDYYIGMSTLFPSGFPHICTPGTVGTKNCWFQIMELYGPPYGGSPPISLGVIGDSTTGSTANKITLSGFPAGYFAPGQTSYNIWTSPDVSLNNWQDFVLHVHFSNCGGGGTNPVCPAGQAPGFVQLWYGNQSQPLSRQTFSDGSQTSYFTNLLGPPFGVGKCGVNYVPLGTAGCNTSGAQSNYLYIDQYRGAQDMNICPDSGGSCTVCLSTDTSCYYGAYRCPSGYTCSATPALGTINIYQDEAKIGTTFGAVVPGGNGALPTVSLTASPPTIESGQSSKLSWTSSGSSSCSARSPANWTISSATSGSQTVSPSSTTTYTLDCQDIGGDTATVSSTITVSGSSSSTSGTGGSTGSPTPTTPSPTQSSPSGPPTSPPEIVSLTSSTSTQPVSGVISIASASDCVVDGKHVSCSDINTKQLSDGTHTIVAQVHEANGQTVTVKKTIDVNNHQGFIKNAELKYGKAATYAAISGGSLIIIGTLVFMSWYIIFRPRLMLTKAMLHHLPAQPAHYNDDISSNSGNTKLEVVSPPSSSVEPLHTPTISDMPNPQTPRPGDTITPKQDKD